MNVIEAAKAAGATEWCPGWYLWTTELERFAQIIRNQALEDAATACQKVEVAIDGGGNSYFRPADARQCVRIIRAMKKDQQ